MKRYEFNVPSRDEPTYPGEAPSVVEALGHTVMAFEALDEQLSTAISFLLRRTDDVGRIVSADLSGLETAFDQSANASPALAKNWATVKDWKETSRYDATIDLKKARDLYRAATGRNGVLAWLRQNW